MYLTISGAVVGASYSARARELDQGVSKERDGHDEGEDVRVDHEVDEHDQVHEPVAPAHRNGVHAIHKLAKARLVAWNEMKPVGEWKNKE